MNTALKRQKAGRQADMRFSHHKRGSIKRLLAALRTHKRVWGGIMRVVGEPQLNLGCQAMRWVCASTKRNIMNGKPSSGSVVM